MHTECQSVQFSGNHETMPPCSSEHGLPLQMRCDKGTRNLWHICGCPQSAQFFSTMIHSTLNCSTYIRCRHCRLVLLARRFLYRSIQSESYTNDNLARIARDQLLCWQHQHQHQHQQNKRATDWVKVSAPLARDVCPTAWHPTLDYIQILHADTRHEPC